MYIHCGNIIRKCSYVYMLSTPCKKLNVRKLFPSLTLKLQFDVSVRMSLTCLLERQIGKEISEVSYLIWYLNSLTVSGSNNYVVEILSARKILCQLLQKQHSFCLHLKHVTEKAIQVHDVNAFKEDILVDIMYFIINEVEELLKQFKPKDIY